MFIFLFFPVLCRVRLLCLCFYKATMHFENLKNKIENMLRAGSGENSSHMKLLWKGSVHRIRGMIPFTL